MNIGNFKAKVDSKEAVEDVLKFLAGWDFSAGACRVEINEIGATLSYKAVFWIWMRALAKSFSERGEANYSCEEIHDIVCHKFLGYTPEKKIGRTIVKPALRTLTYPEELSRGAYFDLFRELELWASDNGVVLPQKKASQYEEDKARANS